MRLRWLVLLLVLSALLLPTAAVATESLPPGGSFVDDDGNAHEGNIEAIAAKEITRGCNPPQNTHFCPADAITRGEMAAFLRRAFELADAPKDYFDDDDGTTFEADINALAHAEITSGCNPPANDLYCPGKDVTRGEMAAFLRRAFSYDASDTDHFDDDNGHLFEADINAIAKAEVTKGCNPPANDQYCPDDPVARDEMASFLARAEGLAPIALPEQLDLIEDFAIACDSGSPPHCFGQGQWPAGQRFYIRHAWVLPADHTSSERADFEDSDTEFRLFVNGTRQSMEHASIEIGDERERRWTIDYPDGMTGTSVDIVGQWWFDGALEVQIEVEVDFE